MNIGRIIRRYRIAKNMTQEDMANALHVTPQAVSRWETGVSYPDTSMLPAISRLLIVSVDELLGCDAPVDVKELEPQELLSQSQLNGIWEYIPVRKDGSKRVLVVDDSDFMRRMLKDILGSEGHVVLEAGNGAEALAILAVEAVEFCILDINMPVLNGIDTLEIIKEKYTAIKTIILSAHCTKAVVEECYALRADSFVAKPFAADSILKRIGTWTNDSSLSGRSEFSNNAQDRIKKRNILKFTSNEVIKALISRKSCMSYQDRHISELDMQQIVSAGLNAPSGMNIQTPIFIVVTADEMVKELAEMKAEKTGLFEDSFYGAKDVIVVLAKKVGTYLYDGSLAMGNLMNAAWALGIDSRWIHGCKEVFEGEKGKTFLEKLNITDDVEGIAFCILGYADKEREETEIQQGRVYMLCNEVRELKHD